jgi:hypothetical protein
VRLAKRQCWRSKQGPRRAGRHPGNKQARQPTSRPAGSNPSSAQRCRRTAGPPTHRSRGDGVDPDALVCQLEGQAAGEADNGTLGAAAGVPSSRGGGHSSERQGTSEWVSAACHRMLHTKLAKHMAAQPAGWTTSRGHPSTQDSYSIVTLGQPSTPTALQAQPFQPPQIQRYKARQQAPHPAHLYSRRLGEPL